MTHLIVLLLDFPRDSFNLYAHHQCVKKSENWKYLFSVLCWHNSMPISRRRTVAPSSIPFIALNWEWAKCCIISKITKQTVENVRECFRAFIWVAIFGCYFNNADEEKWNKCDDTTLQNFCTTKEIINT